MSDNGVPSLSDTVWVIFKVLENPDPFFINNGFSPNGDGENDTFFINGLELYPDNHLLVFNRWGNVVFETDSYTNDWGGVNLEGKALPDGTYYYILDLGNGDEPYAGFVLIFR